MRTAMQDVAKQFQSSLSALFGGSASEPEKEVRRNPLSSQPILAVLMEKGFSPRNISDGKYEQEVTMTLSFKNKTSKEIRAFDGYLEYTDLLDNEIVKSRVEINESIATDSSLTWVGALEYNQFNDSHERFRSEPKENLKLSFHTGKILFADGTTRKYE